ncbi:TIGR03862 family flavoprotein [Variovorax sp. YR752]|uniref:TIGR03862 family flavoprotein n=1 Tax=Variovorax sp. YR752 TaxID=1884383 RepID=UPI003137B8DC
MTDSPTTEALAVAIIGGGPAGLMAAEVLAGAGVQVDLFDGMPSVGRKFLLAGKGGLNLTHSEPIEPFLGRYGQASEQLAPWLHEFGPQALRDWAKALGVDTFVGSSGRVFPTDMKAAPLLRAWLHRLRASGVRLHMRHRWLGWGESRSGVHALRFATPAGERLVHARCVVLALGGASWSRLGSDGAWVPLLAERGIDLAPLRASNCGFDVAGWSEHLRERFAGAPLKNVALRCAAPDGRRFEQRGEFVLTESGIEGSLVYAASPFLRETIAATGRAIAEVDLLPERPAEFVHAEVARPRGSRSMSTHLKSRLGIDGAKAALLHELLPREVFADAAALAAAIKALPIPLVAARPIDEAISTAGGVRLDALDAHLMLKALPGVFCAGEMLDWEAPTGGYLLTASLASGRIAGQGAAARLASTAPG